MTSNWGPYSSSKKLEASPALITFILVHITKWLPDPQYSLVHLHHPNLIDQWQRYYRYNLWNNELIINHKLIKTYQYHLK